MNKTLKKLTIFTAIILTLGITYGCRLPGIMADPTQKGHEVEKDTQSKLPKHPPIKNALRLQPIQPTGPDYSLVNGFLIMDNKDFKITIRQLRHCCGANKESILNELFEKNYLLMRLTIKNKSKKRITYNPSHTYLLAGKMDYKKPLNYTDLYDILSKKDDGTLPEIKLSKLRGKYYDLNTSIAPGATETKILLFRPMSKNSNRSKAILKMNEIYIGTKTRSIIYLFKVRSEPILE